MGGNMNMELNEVLKSLNLAEVAKEGLDVY
jgi:hypothetical protein